jgi:hypothetical protein
MKSLPQTANPLLLRTDFSDDTAWQALCAAMRQPSTPDGFVANLEVLSDSDFTGATVEQVVALSGGHDHGCIFVADQQAFSSADHDVLVIDLSDQPGRTFRAIPSEAWGIENNLSIANMDFEEFADAVGADGVFRGFNGQ